MRSRVLVFFTLLVIACATTEAYGEGFYIADFKPDTDSLSSEVHVLLAGGYAYGLESGMKGTVLTIDINRDTSIIGTGEVLDVAKYEATCLVQRSGEQIVQLGDRVDLIDLEAVEPEQAVLMERGQKAFDAEDFEQAEFFLSAGLRNASSEDSLQLKPLIEKSRSMIEKELKRKLRGKERKQEESREAAYRALARGHIVSNRWTAARYYFKKLLRIDSGDKRVREVVKRIDELRDFDAEKAGRKIFDETGYPPDSLGIAIMPKMIKRTRPQYPEGSRRIGQEGTVWVKALVVQTGKVLFAEVAASSGISALDDAAIEAAYHNEFTPGAEKGRAVNCWVTYKVEFQLGGL